jgi:hypothetical protein
MACAKRKLIACLAGSDEWIEFPAALEFRKIVL